ncbi:flagellar basal body L-ring protein FlgH [Sandaracinobacter neustonicus]|uniref:Flagellar L-ring protein n=1 Tax=Sandaracinobacter neustonicus TaxID=1715348 RepID=A0A501XED6_9SPHN|nr:flagellar basal body L-ring protein FlgH [Sandaracinobacter neustonicus]TPE59008.1 flagellar basal body L-ring protein FlgH [Sandaracinobacter neustonicus]
MSTKLSKLLPFLFLLNGCSAARHLSDAVPPVPVALAEAPAPAAPTGGIWQASAGGLALAEDRRARRMGDLLTIRLVERIRAEKSVEQDSSRTSNRSLDLPNAWPLNKIDEGLFSGGTSSSFAGSGGASQANSLSGEFTVTVVRVLPNGALMVAGDRRIRLVRGEEQVQLTGIVRPEDIGPDNRVPSTRVADARLRFTGTGEVANQARQGWLSRFFDAVTPF